MAVARVDGDRSNRPAHHTFQFSGYESLVRAPPSDRGGTNRYGPANAWTDASGATRLRIAGQAPDWTCAYVSLTRRLGYGSYHFVVQDITQSRAPAPGSLRNVHARCMSARPSVVGRASGNSITNTSANLASEPGQGRQRGRRWPFRRQDSPTREGEWHRRLKGARQPRPDRDC
jgi:hypothetical protein